MDEHKVFEMQFTSQGPCKDHNFSLPYEYSADWATKITRDRFCYNCGTTENLIYSPDVVYICRECLRNLPPGVAIRTAMLEGREDEVVMVPACM